ncbi:MAG: threonine--tRNA ligase [Patescibacteria group bacterium]
MENKEQLERLRHSTAHLLAAAVLRLWPDTKLTIGPAIENGFYYDFDFTSPISEADLPKIEKKMSDTLKDWNEFTHREVTETEAKEFYKDNPYKLELIDEIVAKGEKITFYKVGRFEDLCRGGHSEHPNQDIGAFKLLSLAGAYWRGSEKNKMLTRIYGTSFPTQEELDDHLNMLEEAKKRDHRKLGQELDFFSTNPLTGQGLILWHPKLSITRNEVEKFWKDVHYQRGYQLVYTPHIATMEMFVKSRHLSKYINSMFPVMLHQYIEGESAPDYQTDEVLKPMNCPNHIQIFKARLRSYKELPLRIGELGTVYRYERAGVLHGMTRVRGFTQDDSHIFCTTSQVIDEVKNVLDLTKYFYDIFGFNDFQAYISTRPEKYLGTIAMWDFAQESLKKALEDKNISYKIDEGEGVFYGPKIDIKVKDSLGREWQLGTVQFDFNQPAKEETTEEEIDEFWKLKTFKEKFKTREKLADYLKKLGRGFDVTFINSEGKEERVVMIHRVVLGSIERFFGILIEHYAGAFPVWLAPVQVALLPIADRHQEYAEKVAQELRQTGIRVEVNSKAETLQNKIREATLQKVPFMGIIGDKEIADNAISVRLRTGEDQGSLTLSEFRQRLKEDIDKKK